MVAANLFNVHKDVLSMPSTWFVAWFLPSLGPESKWDECGGNSKSVMSTELTMECNDCCFRRKLAQQIEREKEKQPLAKETNGRPQEKNQTQVTEGKKETVALYAAATTLAASQINKLKFKSKI